MADDIYPDRFCAFVDILGFRGLVARLGKDTGAVGSLRDILKEVHNPKISGLAPASSVDYRTQSISDAAGREHEEDGGADDGGGSSHGQDPFPAILALRTVSASRPPWADAVEKVAVLS
jgi:hypothetical protein